MSQEKIATAVKLHASALESLVEVHGEDLEAFTGRLVESFTQEGRLLVLGNGSLAAVADLVANQFLHRLALERPILPAVSLCHDAVLATSLFRDGLGQQFFARQLRALARAGDVVLVFAESRRDEALAEALSTARQLDCHTVVLGPGKEEIFGVKPDRLFPLESDSPARAAEVALFFGHLLCELVEESLFGV